MRARSPRGQATVELVLGGIVFVTVLLAGIHFAELAQLSLKTHDAAAFAVWESTGKQVLRFEDDGSSTRAPFNQTIATLGREATNRFEDFDGLSSSHGSAVVTRALTKGKGLEVKCPAEQAASRISFAPSATVAGYYRDVGGLSCTASSRVEAVRVPRQFLQNSEGGFFDNENTWVAPIVLCSMGQATNRRCDGELAVLTGDWGFWGEREQHTCPLGSTCLYEEAVRRLYGRHQPGSAGARFAAAFTGSAPYQDPQFNFSYQGIDADYLQSTGGEVPPGKFDTGGPGVGLIPFHSTAGRCFLGRVCSP